MNLAVVSEVAQSYAGRPTALGPSSRWEGLLADGREVRILHVNPWLSVRVVGGERLFFAKHEEPDMTTFGMMQATSKALDWSLMQGALS